MNDNLSDDNSSVPSVPHESSPIEPVLPSESNDFPPPPAPFVGEGTVRQEPHRVEPPLVASTEQAPAESAPVESAPVESAQVAFEPVESVSAERTDTSPPLSALPPTPPPPPQAPPTPSPAPESFATMPAPMSAPQPTSAPARPSTPRAASPTFPSSWRNGLVVSAVAIVIVSSVSGGFFGYLAGVSSTSGGSSNETIVMENTTVPTRPIVVANADGIAGIASAVSPTVVKISVSSKDGTADGTGSGFIIRSDGYIITNAHVADIGKDGGEIEVAFANGDTTTAELVGVSEDYDIAVLKVKEQDLPTIQWGDSSNVQVGELVVALGSPLGLQGTVTSGIVSALDRPVTTGGDINGEKPSFLNAIQTDAAINPGNSGGPLVDGSGFVIGVNSAIATNDSSAGEAGSIGLGFAIPSDTARRVATEIIETGKSTTPIIGVKLDNLYVGPGAKVSESSTDGPAYAAGVRDGDIIIKIGDQRITTPVDLIVAVRDNGVGEEIDVTVQREDKVFTYSVELAQASE